MTYLIASLGAGKGTWAMLQKLLQTETWDKVFLITNSFGKEKFTATAEFIVIDDLLPIETMVPLILSGLKGKIADTEVAVNFASGSGAIHMAILAALLKLGFGIRLIGLVKDKAEEY